MSRVGASLEHLPQQLLLDGGCGTSLMAKGLDVLVEPSAVWNLTHPEEVLAMHRAFIKEGAGAIQTNTFAANIFALARAPEHVDVRLCNLEAVRLAREAAGEDHIVIGNIGPTGCLPPPQGDANLFDLEAAFAEQAAALLEGGVDFLHLETMAHPKELRAALRGCREGAKGLPVVASMACRASADVYKTTMGFNAELMFAVALEEKAEGIGANCMLTPFEMIPLIERLAKKTSVPIFAKPTIAPDGGAPLYPDEFAEGVAKLFAAGASAVGGCCGTSARDIGCARGRIDRGYA